jgi:hypothetical protein
MEVRGDAGGFETRPYWRLAAERWTKLRRGCVSNEPETKHIILLGFPSNEGKAPRCIFYSVPCIPEKGGRSTIVERQIVVRFPPASHQQSARQHLIHLNAAIRAAWRKHRCMQHGDALARLF